MLQRFRQLDARIEEQFARRERIADDRLESWAEKNEQQIQSRLDGLATKQELEAKLKELELRMVIKMGAMILASVGMIVGLQRAYPTPVQLVNTPQEMHLARSGACRTSSGPIAYPSCFSMIFLPPMILPMMNFKYNF
ncbi:MAG: hypothetical protein HQM04_00855 [Magnetococcales bacterium]|nr:hypothetical protein [Magnetococcales bacterium]MBF0113567.1 hypothetical protein [Magnetococcales bacterium]